MAIGRGGLGSNLKPSYRKASVKEKRKLIQEEVRAEVEEARFSRMVGMSKQGAWTKWEHTAGISPGQSSGRWSHIISSSLPTKLAEGAFTGFSTSGPGTPRDLRTAQVKSHEELLGSCYKGVGSG